MRKVSLSKSALVLSPCIRWASDEAVQYDEAFSDTSKRDKGILFHDTMDMVAKNHGQFKPNVYGLVRRSEHTAEVQPWVDKAIQWFSNVLWPRCESVQSEVYVAYNFATQEVHTDATVQGRNYPDILGHVPGTADLVCLLHTGELLVADWKTGGGVGADKQLMSLACGLRHVYRDSSGLLPKVRLAVLYAGEADHTGTGVQVSEWAVTEEELVAHELSMAFQLADVESGKRSEAVIGIHCTQLYCPHLGHCSGVAEIVGNMSDKLLEPEQLLRKTKWPLTVKPQSDEEAGSVMEQAYAAKRQYEYIMAGVKKYVSDGGRAPAGDFEYKQTDRGFRWVKR